MLILSRSSDQPILKPAVAPEVAEVLLPLCSDASDKARASGLRAVGCLAEGFAEMPRSLAESLAKLLMPGHRELVWRGVEMCGHSNRWRTSKGMKSYSHILECFVRAVFEPVASRGRQACFLASPISDRRLVKPMFCQAYEKLLNVKYTWYTPDLVIWPTCGLLHGP